MPDREPLRAGPLELKWDDDNQAGARLSKRCTLGVYRTSRGLWRYIAVFDLGEVQEVYGETRATVELAVRDAEGFLSASGYLAQYRSRRRLLAKWCIARANHWAHFERQHLDKVDQIRRYGTDGEQEHEASAERYWHRRMQLRSLAERLRNG